MEQYKLRDIQGGCPLTSLEARELVVHCSEKGIEPQVTACYENGETLIKTLMADGCSLSDAYALYENSSKFFESSTGKVIELED